MIFPGSEARLLFGAWQDGHAAGLSAGFPVPEGAFFVLMGRARGVGHSQTGRQVPRTRLDQPREAPLGGRFSLLVRFCIPRMRNVTLIAKNAIQAVLPRKIMAIARTRKTIPIGRNTVPLDLLARPSGSDVGFPSPFICLRLRR